MINVENNQVTNSKCEKLLGIKIDHNKLTFNTHIGEMCKKAGQKMNASRVIPHMDINTIYEYCKTAHSFKDILHFAV